MHGQQNVKSKESIATNFSSEGKCILRREAIGSSENLRYPKF